MLPQPPPGAPAVKVMDGPFAGFEGVVSGIDQAQGRIQVLLSFYGKKITIDVDVRQVRRLVP